VPPLVSIIIPTYNRASDLERALASVVAQTYDRWEVLVVDNHSTDGTDRVVGQFNNPQIAIYQRPKIYIGSTPHNDRVIAASRNVGLRHARGEYVALLDSDDWWAPRKLEQSVAALDAGADLVYHALSVVTKTRQRLVRRRTRTRDLKSPIFEDLLVNGNAIDNSSVMVRRGLLEQIGGFSEDPSLISVEDYDAWLRIARMTERFVRIRRTLGYYWAGGGNISRPERTIATVHALEQLYAADLGAHASGKSYYLNYLKGRAWYRLKQYAKAKESLTRVRGRRVPLTIAARREWMLSLINMRLRLAADPRKVE